MLWIGLILAASGGALVYFAGQAADRVLHMKVTETSQIGGLRSLVEQIRADLGGGASEWRELVEIKGSVGCDRPLVGELSGEPAVVVRGSVVREVEELRREEDSEGRVTERWVSRNETVNSTKLEAPFWIDDGSGRLDVRPSGATYTLQTVVDRFEPPAAVERGSSIHLGRLEFAVGGFSRSHSLRVKGYRFREEILPVGARVYALGEASDTSDGMALHKPGDSDKPFILSTKSEEELVAAGMSQAKWMKIGGLLALGLGIALAIVGAVKMVAS